MVFTLSFAQLVEYDAGQTGVLLPIILSTGGKQIEIPAKIDTGSTDCIFARKYGEQLDLKIENGDLVNLGTATGFFKAYRHFVTMKFLNYQFDVGVCFAEDQTFNRNVLGRHGFLDRINLGLVDYEGKLYLSKYGEI